MTSKRTCTFSINNEDLRDYILGHRAGNPIPGVTDMEIYGNSELFIHLRVTASEQVQPGTILGVYAQRVRELNRNRKLTFHETEELSAHSNRALLRRMIAEMGGAIAAKERNRVRHENLTPSRKFPPPGLRPLLPPL